MAAPRPLPRPLDRRLRQLAGQYSRRQRLRDFVRLGVVVLAALLLLEALLPWARSAGLPLIAPVLVLALGAVALWRGWLRRSAGQRLDRRRLALFLDERHPELENLAVTSVEFGEADGPSTWMVQQVLQQARQRAEKLVADDLLDNSLRRLALERAVLWGLVGIAAGSLLFRWGGEVWHQQWPGWGGGSVAWSVEPGHIRLRRSSDQVVWLKGASGDRAKAIHWRWIGGEWRTEAMLPSRTEGLYYYRLAHLQEDVEYQIQVGDRQSQRYRITVWTPPAVESLRLVLQYPDYMRRPERVILESGDIVAPQGSVVQVEIQATKKLETAALVLGGGERIEMQELTADPRRWRGPLPIADDDEYYFALSAADGSQNEIGEPYAIKAQKDEPPQIGSIYPRGDDEATALEEIPITVALTDDFGLRDFGLQYEVAGRPSQRLSLGAGSAGLLEVEETFILDLESLEVGAGDLVTWSVWALDDKPGRDAFSTVGDPYFLEIRPFDRAYRAAVSNQGGEGGGGRGASTPAGQQKKVLIATWNLRRDFSALTEEGWTERMDIILQGQRQIGGGGAATGPLVDSLATAVEGALAALSRATWPEPGAALSRAIVQQQRAYHYLLALRPEQMEVRQGRSGGGGGGQPAPWEGELQALEMTRRRDFRNEASTLNQRQSAAQEARTGLDELARRQQMINRDIDRLLEQGPDESVKGRQLERLLEEQRRNLAQLEEVGAGRALDNPPGRQPMEQVRRQMAQSARALRQGALQGARAAGRRVLDALERAGDQVAGVARQTAAEQIGQLRADWALLRLRQEELAAALRQIGAGVQGRPRRLEAEDEGTVQAVVRDSLAARYAALMNRAGELARRAPAGQELMVRRLGDWLRATSRAGIYEDMLVGQRLAQRRNWPGAETMDSAVATKMAQAGRDLEAVAAALVDGELAAATRALAVLEGLQDEWDSAVADSAGAPFAGAAWEEALANWRRQLRDAESLLPQGAARRGVAGAREALGPLRSSDQKEAVAPTWEDVERDVFEAVEQVVLRLRRQVRQGLAQGRLEPLDGGLVPPLYRAQVAEYFKALGQTEPGD